MQKALDPTSDPRRAVAGPAHSNPVTESYAALLKSARTAGLMRRRRTFYAVVFAVLLVLLAAAGTGFMLLGHTWFDSGISDGTRCPGQNRAGAGGRARA